MKNKRLELVYLLILSQLNLTLAHKVYDEMVTKPNDEKPRVEVRAVFISCASEDTYGSPYNDAVRFEREELFRHSALKDCNKKLALTVKVTSETEQSSGDEYLPIEHVIDGANKKRVRLLDPYILRLRRDVPLQAYKLQKLETVRGVIIKTGEQSLDEKRHESSWSRFQRDLEFVSEVRAGKEQLADTRTVGASYPEIATESQQSQPALISTTEFMMQELKDCENYAICPSVNNTFTKRYKRSEHNIVVETVTDDNVKWDSKETFHRVPDRDRKKHSNHFVDGPKIHENNIHKPIKGNHKKEIIESKHTIGKSSPRKIHRKKLQTVDSKEDKLKGEESELKGDLHSPNPITKETTARSASDKKTKNNLRKLDHNTHSYSTEKDYALYEIGTPDIWYIVHVQLYEKLSSPDGKTVWNDLTKGELASVSSHSPEWNSQDLNVRYRSTKWLPRDEFTLPSTRLCLLVPVNDGLVDGVEESNSTANSGDVGCIVVPEEDILGLNDEDVTKRNDNNSELETATNSSEIIQEGTKTFHRKVMVRMTRAILKGYEEMLHIVSRGTDKYLTLMHKRPHSAQIDLEARADDNDVVRIGSSGRISIAVADSTRKTRTIINLQVGNTGLAAARFRVVAQDLNPPLSDSEKDKELTTAGPILIPPRHTRSLRLELPIEIPVDIMHCAVSLLNDEDLSVAVRDVAIKKGDRCFCVWHCDCVCLRGSNCLCTVVLGDDPRLMCHDMDEAGQKAAGLSTHDRSRFTRSVCYTDVVTLNMFVVFTGVILTLLLLGLIKAILGLIFRPIGVWALHQLLQTPRKLDSYYEKSLRCRPVVYDDDCWPVHPDTRKRTVRVVSMPMEFFLNTILFVSLPCLIVYDVMKHVIARFSSKGKGSCVASHQNTNKCYSAHDMQAVVLRRRRRRERLRRWMTPQAQELSADVWEKSLNLQPLLREKRECIAHLNGTQDSLPDSEQDDTDYVLTQMQKSRESLARSQKKLCDLDPSTIATSPTKEQNVKCDNN